MTHSPFLETLFLSGSCMEIGTHSADDSFRLIGTPATPDSLNYRWYAPRSGLVLFLWY